MPKKKDKPASLPARALRWGLYFVIATPILQFLNRLLFGLRIEGRKHLKGIKGAVLCCNHVHYLDSTMIACAVSPRRVTFATLATNFKLPIAGWLIKQFGCVSVGASVNETKEFIRNTAQQLKDGDLVGIYPEGELKPYCTTLRKFHGGAFQVSVMSNTPVIPMMILQRPKKGLWHLSIKPPLTIRLGAPIWPPAEGTPREKRDFMQEKCLHSMAAIQEAFQEEHPAKNKKSPD